MDIVNAISKVRFASTGPQNIHLARTDSYRVDMLCMEAGQKSRSAGGPCAYYVIAGSATLTTSGSAKLTTSGSATLTANGSAGPDERPLPAGQIADLGPDEPHVLANAGEGRLICLVVQAAG